VDQWLLADWDSPVELLSSADWSRSISMAEWLKQMLLKWPNSRSGLSALILPISKVSTLDSRELGDHLLKLSTYHIQEKEKLIYLSLTISAQYPYYPGAEVHWPKHT
jgi:hypothetical protein